MEPHAAAAEQQRRCCSGYCSGAAAYLVFCGESYPNSVYFWYRRLSAVGNCTVGQFGCSAAGGPNSWDFGLYARVLYVASTSKKLIHW